MEQAALRQTPASLPQVGEGVTPDDFFPLFSDRTVTLSPAFGVAERRAFDERLPLPYTSVWMEFTAACAVCDVSFLTNVTSLTIDGLENGALTLPTSVVSLEVFGTPDGVTFSGTESLTSLALPQRASHQRRARSCTS